MPAGLTLDVLSAAGARVTFAPRLIVGGLGVRLARSGGPLLDAGVAIEQWRPHFYASVDKSTVDGGVQVAVGVGWPPRWPARAGATTPWRPGCSPPAARRRGARPAFSPALAVQRTGGSTTSSATTVTLRAGVGTGPWMVIVER